MPNHITNKLIISKNIGATDAMVDECFNSLKDGDSSISFAKILPIPFLLRQTREFGGLQKAISLIDAYDNGTISKEDKEFMDTIFPEGNHYPKNDYHTLAVKSVSCHKIYGFYTWYDWCINNWGTKWDAYYTKDRTKYEYDKGKFDDYIVFSTAWKTPRIFFETLSKMFPQLIFTIQYADEDRGNNYGEYELHDGVYFQDNQYSGNEREDILISLLDCE